MSSKENIEALIRQTIQDGDEVAIYNGEDLRAGDFPTTGVTPVYVGRIEQSAIYELNGGVEKKPLTHGIVQIITTDSSVTTNYDVVAFDFR